MDRNGKEITNANLDRLSISYCLEDRVSNKIIENETREWKADDFTQADVFVFSDMRKGVYRIKFDIISPIDSKIKVAIAPYYKINGNEYVRFYIYGLILLALLTTCIILIWKSRRESRDSDTPSKTVDKIPNPASSETPIQSKSPPDSSQNPSQKNRFQK